MQDTQWDALQDAMQDATGDATQVVVQAAVWGAMGDTMPMGSSLKLWHILARVIVSLKATILVLLLPVQPGNHPCPPCPFPAESRLPQAGKKELGGSGGAELWEREAPTVTRTTGCSPEPLVAAAASLQTSPDIAGAPLPPNPQPGGCSSPTKPLRHSLEKHWRPPQGVQGEGSEPPSSSSWENTDRGLSGAPGSGGWAGAELLAGCN